MTKIKGTTEGPGMGPRIVFRFRVTRVGVREAVHVRVSSGDPGAAAPFDDAGTLRFTAEHWDELSKRITIAPGMYVIEGGE
jgi:hypothetical protein